MLQNRRIHGEAGVYKNFPAGIRSTSLHSNNHSAIIPRQEQRTIIESFYLRNGKRAENNL